MAVHEECPAGGGGGPSALRAEAEAVEERGEEEAAAAAAEAEGGAWDQAFFLCMQFEGVEVGTYVCAKLWGDGSRGSDVFWWIVSTRGAEMCWIISIMCPPPLGFVYRRWQDPTTRW